MEHVFGNDEREVREYGCEGNFYCRVRFNATQGVADDYRQYPADGNTASLDFILTEFRANIPSPASVAMLGLGGMIATRRRR